MNRYRELVVSSQESDANQIARQIELFAEESESWVFPVEKSAEYRQLCGEPSCCIVCVSDPQNMAAVHFTRKRDNALVVANIVPLNKSQLQLAEYNKLIAYTAKLIRFGAAQREIRLAVKLSKHEVRLADVILGKIAKKRFEIFLSMHPLSYHPLDIRRLDAFICALSSFKRKPFDLEAFECLLVEELGWPKHDANWCRTRVEIGLDILEANKGFWH